MRISYCCPGTILWPSEGHGYPKDNDFRFCKWHLFDPCPLDCLEGTMVKGWEQSVNWRWWKVTLRVNCTLGIHAIAFYSLQWSMHGWKVWLVGYSRAETDHCIHQGGQWNGKWGLAQILHDYAKQPGTGSNKGNSIALTCWKICPLFVMFLAWLFLQYFVLLPIGQVYDSSIPFNSIFNIKTNAIPSI